MTDADARRHSAPAERNRGPILDVLKRVLPSRGKALEIAAGTGQHAVHFAAGLPGWIWTPTDPEPSALASIAAWSAQAGLDNLRPPERLDVLEDPWLLDGPFDAVFCANMLHISPWATCAALMRGAARLLSDGGQLVIYGPYFVQGQPASAGNVAFDADLRSRDPSWGLRYVHDVQAQAHRAGLELHEQVPMPAHNFTLVFRRPRR